MSDALENTKTLNNTLMQLRKIINHPYCLEGVEENINGCEDEYGEHLIDNCPKL